MLPVLGEWTYPDRLRLRLVPHRCGIEGCECQSGEFYVAVAGAELGGVELDDPPAAWRWMAYGQMRAPIAESLEEFRADFDSAVFRAATRRCVATFGCEWRQLEPRACLWQMRSLEGMPEWMNTGLALGGWDERELWSLRRCLVGENPGDMRPALAALRRYEERVFEGPAELDV